MKITIDVDFTSDDLIILGFLPEKMGMKVKREAIKYLSGLAYLDRIYHSLNKLRSLGIIVEVYDEDSCIYEMTKFGEKVRENVNIY